MIHALGGLAERVVRSEAAAVDGPSGEQGPERELVSDRLRLRPGARDALDGVAGGGAAVGVVAMFVSAVIAWPSALAALAASCSTG